MINPYAILGGVLLLIATHGATAWWFHGAGHDSVIADQAEVEAIRQSTIKAADEGTARALSKLEIKHVTIKQQAQTVVREVPVYSDCRHDKRMLNAINAALTGDEPIGDGVVPAASPPGR